MKQQNKDQNPKNKKSSTPQTTLADQQKQKAETEEVAGKHKNDGQKDHKGAR